jgi:hypothetical protein
MSKRFEMIRWRTGERYLLPERLQAVARLRLRATTRRAIRRARPPGSEGGRVRACPESWRGWQNSGGQSEWATAREPPSLPRSGEQQQVAVGVLDDERLGAPGLLPERLKEGDARGLELERRPRSRFTWA